MGAPAEVLVTFLRSHVICSPQNVRGTRTDCWMLRQLSNYATLAPLCKPTYALLLEAPHSSGCFKVSHFTSLSSPCRKRCSQFGTNHSAPPPYSSLVIDGSCLLVPSYHWPHPPRMYAALSTSLTPSDKVCFFKNYNRSTDYLMHR